MTKFIANIELEHGSERDYNNLSIELEKSYFKHEHNASPNVPVMLGYETFTRVGDLKLQDIDNAVTQAAAKTGKKFSFFVIRNKS